MQALLEKMMDAPDVQLLINQAQKQLLDEKKKRQEFYEWLTDDVKAEFINGQIVMHSPVFRGHLNVSEKLYPLLNLYVGFKNLGVVSVEKAMVSLTRNDYEPDICFWGIEKSASFDEETLRHPAPDFVAEILSKGTEGIDRGVKFKDYAAHGVKEYWIVNHREKIVEKYVLTRNGELKFELVGKFKVGETIESEAIMGFAIPVKAIFYQASYLQAVVDIVTK